MAKLHFYYGAMDSGKSVQLLSAAHNYESRGHSIVTMKPSTDTKADSRISSRIGLERDVDILALPDMNLREAVNAWRERIARELACVLVDEAQFLQPVQVEQLFEVAKLDDTSVVTYGLRSDFRTRGFPGSQRLMELADNIEKLKTMCRCGSQAEHNTRKVNGVYVFAGDQVAIDGKDEVSYDSLCGKCYLTERAITLAQ